MDLKINTVHFKADKKLLEFVEKKVKKLTDKNDQIVNMVVHLKFEKEKIDNKIVEISVNIAKHDFFSKKESSTFEEAVDLALEAIKSQLSKLKTNNRTVEQD